MDYIEIETFRERALARNLIAEDSAPGCFLHWFNLSVCVFFVSQEPAVVQAVLELAREFIPAQYNHLLRFVAPRAAVAKFKRQEISVLSWDRPHHIAIRGEPDPSEYLTVREWLQEHSITMIPVEITY